MLKESFIATTPNEAYKLAIQKYGSIENFKVISASQFKGKDGTLNAEITIEIEEEIFNEFTGIDEEEALLEEIKILKSKMDRMKDVLAPKKNGNKTIEEVKSILTNKGLNKSWVDLMLNPFIGTQVAEDKSLLLSFVLEEIEDSINVAKTPIDKKVNLFVGPTGVGKTTTLAKIVAWCISKGIKEQSIALINLDNYRVGAYEQLGFYAKSLGVDYFCVESADDLFNLLNNLSNKDLIFLDTAGSSPYDIEKLLNTVKLYRSSSLDDSSVNLVVSSASKYVDFKDIYEHFSFLNIDRLIVTKVDETRNTGNLIAFLLDTKLPVSYITTGQNVPKDLQIASKRAILENFIGDIDEE
jgi:flagellar biosynthesis protein FlhF